jgi:hypothetical protein
VSVFLWESRVCGETDTQGVAMIGGGQQNGVRYFSLYEEGTSGQKAESSITRKHQRRCSEAAGEVRFCGDIALESDE